MAPQRLKCRWCNKIKTKDCTVFSSSWERKEEQIIKHWRIMVQTYISNTKFRLKIKKFNFYTEIKGGHIEQFLSQKHLPSFEPMKWSTCAGKCIRLISRNSSVLVSLVSRGRGLKSHQLSTRIKNKIKLQKNQAKKLWNPIISKIARGLNLCQFF